MLKSWDDVVSTLAGFPRRAERDRAVSFDFPQPGPTPATFHVLCEELHGRQRIVICLNVLPEVQVQTGQALRINSEILLGGLISFRGYIALRHVMTLGRFDAIELHEVLSAMALTRHRVAARLAVTAPSFASGYAD